MTPQEAELLEALRMSLEAPDQTTQALCTDCGLIVPVDQGHQCRTIDPITRTRIPLELEGMQNDDRYRRAKSYAID